MTILIPRFELKVAAGGNDLLLGSPLALAPADAGERLIGQVSAAAEAFGVAESMTVGEALSRCPQLVLVPPDPLGCAERWEEVLVRLEALGAFVAAPRAGMAQFEPDGLLGLHGDLDRVIAKTRRAAGGPVRIGVAMGGFASSCAADAARPRRANVIRGGEGGLTMFLAGLPVGALSRVQGLQHLPEQLERFGILTLGAFARLGRDSVADRFGRPGVAAHELALGREGRLRPRRPVPRVGERISLPEAAGGQQLAHALDLLLRRILSRRELGGRALRSVAVFAELEGGGTWRREVCFREALAARERMLLALSTLLDGITGPPLALGVSVLAMGPIPADQVSLVEEPREARDARLREAVRQVRAAAGPDSALRVVEVDPGSRLPERRMAFSPFEI